MNSELDPYSYELLHQFRAQFLAYPEYPLAAAVRHEGLDLGPKRKDGGRWLTPDCATTVLQPAIKHGFLILNRTNLEQWEESVLKQTWAAHCGCWDWPCVVLVIRRKRLANAGRMLDLSWTWRVAEPLDLNRVPRAQFAVLGSIFAKRLDAAFKAADQDVLFETYPEDDKQIWSPSPHTGWVIASTLFPDPVKIALALVNHLLQLFGQVKGPADLGTYKNSISFDESPDENVDAPFNYGADVPSSELFGGDDEEPLEVAGDIFVFEGEKTPMITDLTEHYPSSNPGLNVRYSPTLSRYASGGFHLNDAASRLLSYPSYIRVRLSGDGKGLEVSAGSKQNGIQVTAKPKHGIGFGDRSLWDFMAEKLHIPSGQNTYWSLTYRAGSFYAAAKDFETRPLTPTKNRPQVHVHVAPTVFTAPPDAPPIQAAATVEQAVASTTSPEDAVVHVAYQIDGQAAMFTTPAPILWTDGPRKVLCESMDRLITAYTMYKAMWATRDGFKTEQR